MKIENEGKAGNLCFMRMSAAVIKKQVREMITLYDIVKISSR